ncbi:MAG: hypothetical protein BWY87_01368 [Deltaproteobacteria bacterium ADurb.Bin510]|nr:MAG: hypothetical protein BWY87_01368 [Deltaproteobacteria bacterium ADurb.Bin510]
MSLDDRFVDLMLRYGTDEVRQARIRELYEEGLKAQAVVCSAAGIEAGSLNLLSLIPADYPLYGGLSVGRQHGAVEVGDQQV